MIIIIIMMMINLLSFWVWESYPTNKQLKSESYYIIHRLGGKVKLASYSY